MGIFSHLVDGPTIIPATETVDSLGARTIRFEFQTLCNSHVKESPIFSPSVNKQLKFYLRFGISTCNSHSLCLLPFVGPKMTLKSEVYCNGKSAVITPPEAQIVPSIQTLEFPFNAFLFGNVGFGSLCNNELATPPVVSPLLTFIFELIENATCDQQNITNKVPERELLRDLRQLFENRDYCDVTFAIRGQEVPAHRAILSARSTVFAAMFKHEIKENRDKQVDVDDTEPEVFLEMLRFIYTDEAINERIKAMADKLFHAAEKYQLNRLKTICEDTLIETISVTNALDMLKFADLHGADNLEKTAISFVNGALKVVMETQEFETMANTHPHLLIELLRMWAK